MLLKLTKKNLFKSITLTIIGIFFISLVFAINSKIVVSDEAMEAFTKLPIWLRLIFMIMLPVFGDFMYLYQFTMIYLIPLTMTYSFYLGFSIKSENQIEDTMPISKNKKKLYYFLAPYLHILAILFLLLITTLITTGICYKSFFFEVINGFINLLFWNTVMYLLSLIFRNLKKKYKLIIIISLSLYLILSLIITSVCGVNWFYYLSPLNILLKPQNSFLIYLVPLGIILTLLIIYFTKRLHKN